MDNAVSSNLGNNSSSSRRNSSSGPWAGCGDLQHCQLHMNVGRAAHRPLSYAGSCDADTLNMWLPAATAAALAGGGAGAGGGIAPAIQQHNSPAGLVREKRASASRVLQQQATWPGPAGSSSSCSSSSNGSSGGRAAFCTRSSSSSRLRRSSRLCRLSVPGHSLAPCEPRGRQGEGGCCWRQAAVSLAQQQAWQAEMLLQHQPWEGAVSPVAACGTNWAFSGCWKNGRIRECRYGGGGEVNILRISSCDSDRSVVEVWGSSCGGGQ